MRKLTGLESVSGVHAVAELCVPGEDDLGGGGAAPVRRLLVLEDVQDPGNVVRSGAVNPARFAFRKITCVAAGVDDSYCPIEERGILRD